MKLIKYFGLIILNCYFITDVNAQDIAEVKKGEKGGIKLYGSINIGAWSYSANGIENRRNPIGWYISGAPNLDIYGMGLPFSATISDQERSYSQPFNQFGVSPYYKWAKLHLGYRNLAFSEFTVGGATFMGIGAELSPKKLRLAGFYGRLRRKVVSDSTVPFAILPSYERWAWGAKIGFKTKRGYLDFSFLKSKDIDEKISEKNYITPEDNLVLGFKTEKTFFKKLIFGTDLATSFITTNSRLKPIELDSIKETKDYAFLNDWLVLNATTNVKFAGNTYLGLNFKKFGVRLQYRYVDPGYISHGSNFIQDDIKQYLVMPYFVLFKNRLSINSSVGLQYNNLDKTKSFTTQRTISSVNLSILPTTKVSINIGYSNFGSTSLNAVLQQNDSVYFSLINTSINGSISYVFGGKKIAHQLIFNAMKTDAQDKNEFTKQFSKNDVLFSSIGYNIGISKAALKFGVSTNYTQVLNYNSKIELPGINSSIKKDFFDKKLQTGINYTIQKRFINKNEDGTIQTLRADIRYNYKRKHNISLGYSQTINKTSAITFRNFNENRIRFQYGYTF